MWMTNYSFTFLFPSQVARCGCATSPTTQWTIRYLPASLLPPPHLSSQWLKWTKNLQTHKMFQEAAKQNDKFQVVANETKGKKQKKKNFAAPIYRVVNSQAGSLCMVYLQLQWCWVIPCVFYFLAVAAQSIVTNNEKQTNKMWKMKIL